MNTVRVEKITNRLKGSLGPAAKGNTVASATVIGYTYNYVQGGSWLDGQLHFEDNSISAVKFKTFGITESEVAEAALMFRRHFKLIEVQGVAQVRFLTRCEVKNILLLCFEDLENLTSWSQKSSSPDLFGTHPDNDLLHPWWAKSIRSIVLTIQDMHSHGLYHGGLSVGPSYGVSRSRQLKIVGVANSLEGLDPNAILIQKWADLTGFRDWLRNLMLAQPHHISAIDERRFLDFFDLHNKPPLELNYNELVKKLAEHPFLLSPSSRVGYCFEIQKAYENKCSENLRDFDIYMCGKASQQLQIWKKQFKHFQGWHGRIKCHSIFETLDEYSPGSYFHKVTTLLRFLRNLKGHYVNDEEVCSVDRSMRKTLCPGFLSYLHEHHMKVSDRIRTPPGTEAL